MPKEEKDIEKLSDKIPYRLKTSASIELEKFKEKLKNAPMDKTTEKLLHNLEKIVQEYEEIYWEVQVHRQIVQKTNEISEQLQKLKEEKESYKAKTE